MDLEEQKNDSVPRVAWSIKRYDVMTPAKTVKRIVDGVDGGCDAGEMKMILGPSGSGKTSLLSIIAGYLPRANWEGVVLDDGRDAGREPRRSCGLVVQHSLFFWNLTARETLRYQAMLRRPHAPIERQVEELLAELDLTTAADTYCGDEQHKGLSGGERRRLTIAQELLADPGCLLADEPTSGLDAATALLTVATLSRLCKNNAKAVVAVVHQPRSSIFALFDSLLILSGGKTVYYGAPGAPLEAYLNELGLPLPPYENPGDFLLDKVAVSDDVAPVQDVPLERQASVMTATKLALDARRQDRDKLVAAYPNSAGAALAKRQAELTSDSIATPVVARQGSWIFQFRVLLARAFKYKLRDEQVAITQISFGIFFATVLGAVYYDTSKSVESVTNRIGAISFSVLLMAFLAFDVVILFPKERDMYRREARAGLHSASAFFHARCVAEVPAHLIAGLCYASIAYYMMGFQAEARKFLIFLAVIELEIITGTSVLIACGTLAKDFAGANNLATLFICIFMMFDGHYINNNEIPPGKQCDPFPQQLHARRRPLDQGAQLPQPRHLCARPQRVHGPRQPQMRRRRRRGQLPFRERRRRHRLLRLRLRLPRLQLLEARSHRLRLARHRFPRLPEPPPRLICCSARRVPASVALATISDGRLLGMGIFFGGGYGEEALVRGLNRHKRGVVATFVRMRSPRQVEIAAAKVAARRHCAAEAESLEIVLVLRRDLRRDGRVAHGVEDGSS